MITISLLCIISTSSFVGGLEPFGMSRYSNGLDDIIRAFCERVALENLIVLEKDVNATSQIVNGRLVNIQFTTKDPKETWQVSIFQATRHNVKGISKPLITSFKNVSENFVFLESDSLLDDGLKLIDLKVEVYRDERASIAYRSFKREVDRKGFRVDEKAVKVYQQIANGNFFFE